MRFTRYNTIWAAAMVAGGLCIGGCNTMHGAGKDIQKTGQALSKAAKKPKQHSNHHKQTKKS